MLGFFPESLMIVKENNGSLSTNDDAVLYQNNPMEDFKTKATLIPHKILMLSSMLTHRDDLGSQQPFTPQKNNSPISADPNNQFSPRLQDQFTHR